jgi:mRNA-degrading endonuclease toxin of MazEF toxin-antitoxin module
LTRDEAIERLSEILIVPSTGNVRDIPTHVRLDESDGMQPCALVIDSVGPIAKGFLVERVTMLGPAKMDQVCRALATATNCG